VCGELLILAKSVIRHTQGDNLAPAAFLERHQPTSRIITAWAILPDGQTPAPGQDKHPPMVP